jgi:AcrR family transcriptional regulator
MKFAPIVSKEIEELTEAPSFAELLTAQYSGRKMPKRERTRTTLLLATDSLLESMPLENITIEQIVASSGVARGTFYQYFQSTNEIIISLLGQFYEDVWKRRPRELSAESAFERVYLFRLYYAKSFAKNAHLFMYFRFFAHRNVELAAIRMNQIERWVKQLENDLKSDKKYAAGLTKNKSQLKVLLRSTGVLWAETLVEYFVFRDSVLHSNIKNIKELTDLSMLMWHRIIFSSDPDITEIRISRSTGDDI